MSPMRIIRKPHLRALFIAGTAAGLASIALCLTLIVRTNQAEQFRRSTSDTCVTVEKLKARIRATFLDGRYRVATDPALDAAQRAAALARYDRELKRYAAAACPTP